MTGDFETCPVGTIDLLQRLEWQGEGKTCPECGGWYHGDGHEFGCKLEAILAAHRERMGKEPPKVKECPGIVSKDCAGWTCTYDKNGVCLTCGRAQGYESGPRLCATPQGAG